MHATPPRPDPATVAGPLLGRFGQGGLLRSYHWYGMDSLVLLGAGRGAVTERLYGFCF